MGSYVCKVCEIGKSPEEFKKGRYGLTSTCKKCVGNRVRATIRANKKKKKQEGAQTVEVEETPESDEPELVDMVADLCERISEVFSDMANLLRR
jgi:hypothetical protein